MERGKRAQSSRLSEMPMRVADSNRMSMVCATPKSSLGKLNIPKSHSVTSEKRTSFFGGRTSGAGLPRTSAFGGVEKIKDTRPLHDKSFVQQCIGQLCEFLTEKGFQGSVSTKTLQSPSTKEFLKMFEFIYSQMDPTFHMPTSKVEEEVPRILKDMGYPFALSKSSMYSVGAPHTWPQVLGALIWLIDTVKIYYGMSDQKDLLFAEFSEDNTDIEEGAEYKKLFLDYTAETYARFMQGADTFEDEDEIYLAKLKKLYNVDEASLALMEEKYMVLRDEVERLETESQTDRLMSKRNEKAKLRTDFQKLQSYHDELESFKTTNLDSKASALDEELEASGLQMESLKQEQSRLQHLLQNQKFTPADIERINREKGELQQTISRLSKKLEEAEQHLWNEEIALAKVKETVELKLDEYHKLARKLKLIPMSAENACGHDFEIKTTEFEHNPMVQYKTQIQMPLSKLISNVEEESTRLTNTKLTLEESIEQVNSNISDKSNDLKQVREQICRLDEKLEHDMQELEREEQKWAAEVKSVENNKTLLEKNVTQGYDEAVEQLKAARQQYHLVVQETNEKRRTVANNLTSVCSSAAEHLSIVEKFFEDQRVKLQRVYAEGIEEDRAALEKLREMVDTFVRKARDADD